MQLLSSSYSHYCLPDWNDIKLLWVDKNNRPGLIWYCQNCQPKLADYFYGPEIRPSIDKLEQKIDTLTRIVTESRKITKTYAQVTGEPKDDIDEI